MRARGSTPGADVQRYIAIGTAPAAFDAWALLAACERAQRLASPEADRRCADITPAMRAEAGRLLSVAVLNGVVGAPTEYVRLLMGVPAEELALSRRKSPEVDAAINTVVDQLQKNAPDDREAMEALARLYRTTNAITGQRDPEKALMYITALHELAPDPGMYRRSRELLIAEVSQGLTREQAQRAREAGQKLARACNCREG
jgi:hypothetical protein